MDHYYVNDEAQSTDEHEVHKEGCTYFPNNRTYLGYYINCQFAVKQAKKLYRNVDGCYTCSRPCHTK